MKKINLLMMAMLMVCTISYAQQTDMSRIYNGIAGQNAPMVEDKDEEGRVKRDGSGNIIYKEVKRDGYGNASGSQYDLAVDGAFNGQTILVLQLYTEESFDFKSPEKALQQKGFSVYRYLKNPPDAKQLKEDLKKSCQLWIISDYTSKLN